VRQRGPSGIDDAVLPLTEHFHPGVDVELEIVARWISPEGKWQNNGESHSHND